jgi:hypothetical protein
MTKKWFKEKRKAAKKIKRKARRQTAKKPKKFN